MNKLIMFLGLLFVSSLCFAEVEYSVVGEKIQVVQQEDNSTVSTAQYYLRDLRARIEVIDNRIAKAMEECQIKVDRLNAEKKEMQLALDAGIKQGAKEEPDVILTAEKLEALLGR